VSFNFELPPVPGGNNGPLQLWLESLRQRMNFLVYQQLNDPGCGLYFDSEGNLAVKHDDDTIVCDPTNGLSVDPAAIDHGLLAGLGDDDHAHYLKEKASGGLASEVPTHAHTGASEAGTLDHGTALTGLTDDDHTQYLKEKASGGVASEVPTHAHTGASEAGQLDHGAALTGLTDDDHTQYVALAPATAARNTIQPSSDVVAQTIKAASGTPTANLHEWQDNAGNVLAKISSVGKGTVVDEDTGFSDPNSHFQAANSSINALLEEIGYVVAQETRGWMSPAEVFCPASWNSAGSAWYLGGSTYGRQCPGPNDTTFFHKSLPIPYHYSATGGGTDLYIDVFWMAAAVPASNKVVRVKVSLDDGWSPGEKPNYTNTDFSVTIPTTVDTTLIYKETLTLTTPTIDTSKENVAVWCRRMGSTDAADTYDGSDWWVVGFQIRSPETKST